ncbi:MAG: DUF4271 domain-containing protein [Bacteroidota bacterium]
MLAQSQPSASPFDLLPRMAVSVPEDSIAITTSSNPFDIVPMPSSFRRPAASSPGFIVEKRAKPLTIKEQVSIYRRFLFITVIVMLIVLTLVVTIFRILIEKIWKAFANDNLLNQLLREQSAGLTWAYLILYLMFLFNAGFFLFLSLRHFGVTLSPSNFVGLMICTGGLAGFFLFKHTLLRIVRYVFPVEKEVTAYNFTIIIFNIVVGFYLVPINLLAAYATNLTEYVIYGAAVLLALTYLFRSLRGLLLANRFLAWHKFHFLLYLCAVELAPLFVIVKLLLQQRGA